MLFKDGIFPLFGIITSNSNCFKKFSKHVILLEEYDILFIQHVILLEEYDILFIQHVILLEEYDILFIQHVILPEEYDILFIQHVILLEKNDMIWHKKNTMFKIDSTPLISINKKV